MDTKLRRTRKFSWVAVFLSVFLPSLFLVSLYPDMSEIAKEKVEEFEQMQENLQEPEDFWIQNNYINYAVEASYYLYGRILQENMHQNVCFDVLEHYGWINDYYYFADCADYYVEFAAGEELVRMHKKRNLNANYTGLLEDETYHEAFNYLYANGMVAYLILEYDGFGNISNVDAWSHYPFDSEETAYRTVQKSIEKYKRNALYFEADHAGELSQMFDKYQVEPKNFRCVFVLYEDGNPFIHMDSHSIASYRAYEDIYLEMGAIWIVVALAVFVAILALLLPFIKSLGTGWEKIFCIPLECVLVVSAGAVFGIIGMYFLMSYTNISFLTEHFYEYQTLEFMGMDVSIQTLFGILMIVNLIGWTFVFWLEYIVAASFRQFCCSPKNYLKERCLGIILCRAIWRNCKKSYRELLCIDMKNNLHKRIVQIVLGNVLVLGCLMFVWLLIVNLFYLSPLGRIFWRLIFLGVYAVGLYVILRKCGQKLQKQYQSVVNASHQMGEGNLKISLEEDLGMFQPLGEELQKVQQGFSKAVVEEAKSQNMKTELITNISHDLKTPLTAIITYVDLLKKENISENERKSYIQTIEQKSQRLKVLIEDLFEVSKVNSGNIKLNLQKIDVVSLLKQIRFEMEDEIEKSNLTFRWNLPEERVVLNLDSQRTYRIFENLLTNMLKYAMPYTRAYVDALILDKKVVIVFRNVSAAELDFDVQRLSERFVRGDASRNTEGHGLGLAIVKSFVEVQKGSFKIDVDGDLFKVTIAWDIE